MRLLASLTLTLLVARVNAFSSTPVLRRAPSPEDAPVPEPPPQRAPELSPDVTFPFVLDTDGDNLVSLEEALAYGVSLPCNNYSEYELYLRITWEANDADGDGHYSVEEARGHYLSLPGEVQAELPACLGYEGNGRRLSDEDTVVTTSPAVAAALKPAILPVPFPPPDFQDNYDSVESTRLGLSRIFTCFQYAQCPPGVTRDDMNDFLTDVLTHFKTQKSIAQLSEQDADAAVKKIKREADERNEDLRDLKLWEASLGITSAATGAASVFLESCPAVGLFLTGASIGTAVAAQALHLKEDEMTEGLTEYITGFQEKVIKL